MGFTNSPLVTYTLISPNKTPNRNHAIDTITVHCFVGQVTAKQGCEAFRSSSKRASCNYVVGHDGSIGLCVEEKDRSWCTGGYGTNKQIIRINGISGSSNDYQAVTIEVASEVKPPYAITEKAYAALIELCADICRRNEIRQLLWEGDKKLVGNVARQNMTVHRWFANKACPGDYIYSRLGDLAAKVNAKLASITKQQPVVNKVPYKVHVTSANVPIYKKPQRDAPTAGTLRRGVYTIVSESGIPGVKAMGKLKSGIGWIPLENCEKL